MKEILINVREELLKNKEEKKRLERFFKEEVNILGVKTTTVNKISTKYFKLIKNKSKKEIFSLCEELFKSGILEECFIACNWAYNLRKNYEKKDFEIFEKWVDLYITNWAVCDSFCTRTMSEVIIRFPEVMLKLKLWTKSNNRWVRRAVAVSLIGLAKKGLCLKDIFEITDMLLLDQDDLVQKGYGWLLKVASKVYQREVFEYVLNKKEIMPRTSLRYAIEKMPKELKEIAMKR
ncbi:MAG: DNA alkylation repair protein [Bacilli bacterium]